MNKAFSFGSDPEFMLKNGDNYVSAIDVVPGSITKRIEKEGHQFYWDNVLAECAIKPSYSNEEMVENFRTCLRLYAEIVEPCYLVPQSSQEYPDHLLVDKRARKAGCKFDNCVYLMKQMKGEDSARDAIKNGSLRTCGGHIHLGQSGGWLDGDGPEVAIAVYCMDLFLGIPSLFMDRDPTSAQRRRIYGQSGRFRNKPYGFEYRSLSNFWLASPKVASLIYDVCEFIVDLTGSKKKWKKLWSFNEEYFYDLLADGKDGGDAFQSKLFEKMKLKDCIDNNDKKTAKNFLQIVEQQMPVELYKRLKTEMSKKTVYNLYKEWSL